MITLEDIKIKVKSNYIFFIFAKHKLPFTKQVFHLPSYLTIFNDFLPVLTVWLGTTRYRGTCFLQSGVDLLGESVRTVRTEGFSFYWLPTSFVIAIYLVLMRKST